MDIFAAGMEVLEAVSAYSVLIQVGKKI